ncbi:Uncharacterized protein YLL056C [Cyberlindnera jadinii]|uniref:Uncharacterized protein YLL056C n=1 Tax=Cyberlindnera jadinii (strain ATCC 18201 / CBS 1600 / BCRC 20928 / JCM 3617 / NBRC 0987 / NRRL Y-1542) TaxID=983966 RepID=A0A0H5C4X4_CYBJN|nr:Uncharacterized protein YLL056C [Cyberlindnera jadinii]
MKVFVTGGSGFIGTIVVKDLISNGHEVVALARSESSKKKLEALGVEEVALGDLQDLDVLAKYARESDGVVHLAFESTMEKFFQSIEDDLAATMAMVQALEGSGKPFISTSGGLTGATALGSEWPDEDSPIVVHDTPFGLRTRNEVEAMKYTKKGVKVMTVILAPIVHDVGDTHAFVPMIAGMSKQLGSVNYIDQAGQRFNAIGEVIKFKAIAETVAAKLDLPTRSVSLEAALEISPMGFIFGLNAPAHNELTKKRLGWEPKHIKVIEDIEKNYSFD